MGDQRGSSTESGGNDGPSSNWPRLSVVVGLIVLAVGGAGVGITSLLGSTDLVPVLIVAVAVIGGAGMAVWLIATQPD